MRPKIYDCFCYCNEDMLLELRFETLWDYVDYFVISEAVYTQVGNPKPLNFDINKFSKYQEKIRYLVVDRFPEGPMDFWKNENYQRNYLVNGLYDAQDQDWISVCQNIRYHLLILLKDQTHDTRCTSHQLWQSSPLV